MTEIEYYYRLQEIAMNSGADDAMDLAAFCDKKMRQVQKTGQPQKIKTMMKREETKKFCENVLEILNNDPYTFKKISEIIASLRLRYSFRQWEEKEVIQMISLLVKENKVEKMYIQDLDAGKGEVRYRKKP